jgi:TPR repeat protein
MTAIGLAVSAIVLPHVANAQTLSRDETIKKGQAAAKAGDYNRVYQLGLPYAQKGDADFQYGLSGVLLFFAENVKIDGVPDQDHRRVGLIWLRKAADGGSEQAMEQLALFYRWGEKGLTRDNELSDCFTQAEGDHKLVAKCRAREHAKGYDQ